MKKDGLLRKSGFGIGIKTMFHEETKTLEFEGDGDITANKFSTKEEVFDVEKIVIKGNIREIKAFVFECYPNLKEIECFSPLGQIGYKAFYNCQKLKSFKTKSNLWFVGKRAFSGCEDLIIFKLEMFSSYESNTFCIQEPEALFLGYQSFESCKKMLECDIIRRLKKRYESDIEYLQDIMDYAFSGSVKKRFDII